MEGRCAVDPGRWVPLFRRPRQHGETGVGWVGDRSPRAWETHRMGGRRWQRALDAHRMGPPARGRALEAHRTGLPGARASTYDPSDGGWMVVAEHPVPIRWRPSVKTKRPVTHRMGSPASESGMPRARRRNHRLTTSRSSRGPAVPPGSGAAGSVVRSSAASGRARWGLRRANSDGASTSRSPSSQRR